MTRTGDPAMRGTVQEWHVLQRVLPATPRSARLARVTAQVACRAWRVPHLQERAALLASELVTTVLRHTGPGALTVRVLMTPRRLRVEVHDPSGLLPRGLDADEDATSTAVVAATSIRWGVDCHRPGAQIWAELPV